MDHSPARLVPVQIQQVGYACHGNIDGDGGGGWWPTDPDHPGGPTYLREGERPVVRVSRNGHSCRNGWNTGEISWHQTGGIDGLVLILDLYSNHPTCPVWRPFEPGHPGGLIPLGLTADGESINEPWAVFRGRLGNQQHNSFESATYVNGSHLNPWDWTYVKAIGWGAEVFGFLTDEAVEGIGPTGPADRDFVRNSSLTKFGSPWLLGDRLHGRHRVPPRDAMPHAPARFGRRLRRLVFRQRVSSPFSAGAA